MIRISGADAGHALEQLTSRSTRAREAAFRTLRDPLTGEPIDQCLVLWFPGPASFTGEDVVELQVHGGRAVIDGVLRILGSLPGFRLAEPGEFARRAFSNGKLDLSEVEGLADLINAQTDVQRQLALRQVDGRLKGLYEAWREQLLQCLAYVEADVDFVDEDDVPEDVSSSVAGELRVLGDAMERHCAHPQRGEVLRNGFRVILAGVPNVGKSSLLNAIGQRDVAIVTDTAGTTRDVVEIFVDLAGFPIVFCDTAGLRATDDVVEQIGVDRALGAVKQSDLVVWICDERGEWPEDALTESDSEAIWIRNKADLMAETDSEAQQPRISMNVSATTGAGISDLLMRIQDIAAARFELTEDLGVLRLRHAECVTACAAHVRAAVDLLESQRCDLELVAEELRLGARALAKIGGRIDVEDLLDRIFGEFCIGK